MNQKMKETVFPFNPHREFFTPEGCYILELSNSAEDPAASIARARVAPGATTRWHRVRDTVERYIILEGKGRVEVGSLPLQGSEPRRRSAHPARTVASESPIRVSGI